MEISIVFLGTVSHTKATHDFFSFLQVGTLNFIRSKAPSAVTNGRDEDKKESSFTAFQGKGKSLRQAKSSGQK